MAFYALAIETAGTWHAKMTHLPLNRDLLTVIVEQYSHS